MQPSVWIFNFCLLAGTLGEPGGDSDLTLPAFSNADDDATDPKWRDKDKADYPSLVETMQYEWRERKGLDYTAAKPESDAHFFLQFGQVACYFDQPHKAARAYKEALQLEPYGSFSYATLLLLAKVYMGQGKFQEASDVLRRAYTQDPHNLQVQLMLQTANMYLDGSSASEETDEALSQAVCDRMTLWAKMAGIKAWTRELCLGTNATQVYQRSFSKKAQKYFKKHKYVTLKKVLPTKLLKKFLKPWYRYLHKHGREKDFATKMQIPGFEKRWLEKRKRWELINDPVADIINYGLASLASRVSGLNLVPSYVFPIVYPAGGFVEPHIDQKDNELSLSLQVEITPEEASWPLYFIDYNYTAKPGVATPPSISIDQWHIDNAKVVTPKNNEGVLYKGLEVIHYRQPLPGMQLTQVVFAWRVPNGVSCNG